VMGASRRTVVMAVMARGLLLTAAGAIGGVAIAASLTRWAASLLFGVSPLDPVTFALAIAKVTGIGVMACVLPAWNAARVAPVSVLRES
jgi:ABC-type antimicrobial peptide transport system permease subunit